MINLQRFGLRIPTVHTPIEARWVFFYDQLGIPVRYEANGIVLPKLLAGDGLDIWR
jgi:hypothetical protein